MSNLLRLTSAFALAALLALTTGSAQQQATNPDGSLRPAGPLTRLFTQDAYTEYALLEPGSESFRIRFLPEQTQVGATELRNDTRGGSEGGDVKVFDPRTGEPLEFTYGQVGDDPNTHAIRAKLPRPVPEGGIGRVLIYKTYKDARTYMMNGEDLVWVRNLSGYRLGVVLPMGYAFASSNVAAQLSTTASGQLKLAFANPSGQANPVTIHARKTAMNVTRQSPAPDMFFDDIKTLYDLGDPAAGVVNVEQTYSDYRQGDRLRLDSLAYLPLQDLKVVDLDTGKTMAPVPEAGSQGAPFIRLEVPIVNERQSAHLRLTGRMSNVGYSLNNGTLVFSRTLRGLRNTILLPAGWDVTRVSQSATIGTQRTPAGPRTFVALINLNGENSYQVTIEARRSQ
jgi:hypothetical protein